ncbi:PBP1A family penicillin-binding protein [Aquibacillus halophilus]|uniref:PBP1A family penicillin-binding protein n=1 Tax=Aquibacillus halophilus TaxID=930132 RepID=A0A6A8DF09_9BACI|nr:PBP1A family penicillin-binding protein [Aquibacillus halophilus]MRH42439.1 PBP1A family penicillin-binding protein [Aquibacillus halophilus]
MANEGQSRTARRKQKKEIKKPIWKKVLLIIGIIFLVSALGVGGLFTYYIATAPDIDESLLSDPASTKVFDTTGELFADLGTEKRTKISYNELPDVLIDAVIATEDARFRSHIGIDLKRIGGAILANITDGFGSEGASTITQQVVKGSFLSPEKRLKRKVQEQWIAIRVDSKYSKEEILEMYLNKIFYGAGSYGVAKAAETYFGKTDLNDLTLPEAALLAGLPQRPSAYDPFVNPDLAQERMDTVLSLMVMHGKISEEQANEAREVTVESLLVDSSIESTPYEAFIQKVAEEIQEKLEIDIYNEGIEIYTTLNQDAQKQVELLLSDSPDNPINYPDEDFQTGLSVLDTKTGAIRAIGGGRNRGNGGWNYAFQGDGRQPGSAFKPITAYGPAIESEKWSTYHQFNDDAPFERASGPIRNWNRIYQGWMSMRYALQESLNVPAVKALEEIGTGTAKPFAESLGIEFNDDMSLRDAIGGTSTNVTPLELAGAYRAFANEGIYNEPYSVTKVIYNDGRSIDLKPEPQTVMSDYTAYMITDLLKTVVTQGTGTAANVSGLPIAGKTGTTSLPDKDGSPDSWFSGYTTNFTIAVWTGYDDQKRVLTDTKIAQQLFSLTMSGISAGIDTPDFVQPNSVVEVTVEKGSNPAMLPSDYTPESEKVTELFVSGTEPTEVSEKYDQIDPVTGLTAEYDEENNLINVSWDYETDDERPVSFDVSAGTDPSNLTSLTTTKETQLEISNVDRDTTYTIEITVISDNNEENVSEPVSVQVEVPEEEIEEEPESEEEEEEENPGDEDNDDEQGDNGQQVEVNPVQNLSHMYDMINNSVSLSWEYQGQGPIAFEITVSSNGAVEQTFNSNSRDARITNLQRDKEYSVRVLAFDKNDPDNRGEPDSINFSTEGLDPEIE